MKLLFDENLSPGLVPRLSDLFPASAHVHALQLGSASDEAVWLQAKRGGFIIVSKDSDFHERSLLYGFPPKVVWIRRGNCSTAEIEQILRRHAADIGVMAADLESAFLMLF